MRLGSYLSREPLDQAGSRLRTLRHIGSPTSTTSSFAKTEMFTIEDKGYFRLNGRNHGRRRRRSRKSSQGIHYLTRNCSRHRRCSTNLCCHSDGGRRHCRDEAESAIICDGDVQFDGIECCLIIARGNVVVDGHSHQNTIIAGGNVTLEKPESSVTPRLDMNVRSSPIGSKAASRLHYLLRAIHSRRRGGTRRQGRASYIHY